MHNHRYVDMDIVRNNLDECWNKSALSCNKQLTVKDIKTLALPNSIDKWDWYYISANINIQEIRDNPNEYWNKFGLSCNRQLTVKDIETLILPNSNWEWKWKWGLISKYINIQEVINNPNKPWVVEYLKKNRGSTDKILEFFKAGLLKHLQKNIYIFRYHTDISVKCEC